MKRISPQRVDARHFDMEAMLIYGKHKINVKPVCAFKASAHKAKAPGETLNTVGDQRTSAYTTNRACRPFRATKSTQKDCQSWIVETAGYLVQNGISSSEIAVYLLAIQQ
ncbi:hypothetical protein CDEST_13273 [Colletotrichum destructivum]|uniref:Uncharacterized protein n=1 Tax=Colletotrichum destructivum TaxID=34406 RepID=A0AAX4IY82_9PEZI|nr:hypothetical protein CDEST_13273 [Colletotrichum destructivum]